MYLLGIDPGCRYAGYGIITIEKSTIYLIEYGLLKLSAAKPLTERVAEFHDFFDIKITNFGITDISLETPFLGKNTQNFLKLGYLRGIVYLLSHKKQIRLHEFSPTEVKQAVTGFGAASKDQVARVIQQLFPRIQSFEREDVSDALAVTLCGLWRGNFNKSSVVQK
jgi:crossover junction endodeoxyribonuclease RuvC